MKIRGFYHVFIPPDPVLACMWIWWVDSQLQAFRDSHLGKYATVDVCITMPAHWTVVGGFEIISPINGLYVTFERLVTEYIEFRYPFAKVQSVRDCSDVPIYEGQTLHHIFQTAKAGDLDDTFVVYFHTKGISNSFMHSIQLKGWKDTLDTIILRNWTTCIKHLLENDVVGVWDKQSYDQHVLQKEYRPVWSGNYWWARGDYLKTLPDPLQSNHYLASEKSDQFPGAPAYRYAFEHWVNVGNPRMQPVGITNVVHYSTFFDVDKVSDIIIH